jgi:hypothetical protein
MYLMLGIMIMSAFNFDTAQTKSREYMHAFYHHNSYVENISMTASFHYEGMYGLIKLV